MMLSELLDGHYDGLVASIVVDHLQRSTTAGLVRNFVEVDLCDLCVLVVAVVVLACVRRIAQRDYRGTPSLLVVDSVHFD